MKTKKQKNKADSSNKILNFTIALLVFIFVISLVLFSSIAKINYEMKRICGDNYYTNTKGVEISTAKNVYAEGEKIELTLKNNKKQSIYFKPCEYLNNFEKKINGEWEKENVVANNNDYNQSSFNKNKSITRCEIELPRSGKGIYRSVVQIYYNCLKPGDCESSEIFYSNEFEIK